LSVAVALVDTSAFLLFFEKLFDVIDHLEEDLDEVVRCATTDSVLRELLTHITERSEGGIAEKYIYKIYEKCSIYTLSEDYEKEEADPDLIRAAAALRGYILTLDKELKKEARRNRIKMIIYRESKNSLELE